MHLLLIEDDHDLGHAVVAHLLAAGHSVDWRQSISASRDAVDFGLVLLDRQLPDGDALSLLREWRVAGMVAPVIALTARDQISDRIAGLQAGADDYVVKPFDLDELLARIDAVARRGAVGRWPPPGLQLDTVARRAQRGVARIELTAMEWAVLSCLAGYRSRIYSRAEIEQSLATNGFADAESNSLEVIVSRLRKKLGPAAISTHRGLGYRLDA